MGISLQPITGRFDLPGTAGLIGNRLLEMGYPPHIVAGLLGNIQQESNFNPQAIGDNGNSYGLGQWNGPRRQALLNHALRSKAKPFDPETQLGFLDAELKGPEAKAWERIKTATTPEEAALLASEAYWRPGDPRNENRTKYARAAMDAFVRGDKPMLPEQPDAQLAARSAQPEQMAPAERASYGLPDVLGSAHEIFSAMAQRRPADTRAFDTKKEQVRTTNRTLDFLEKSGYGKLAQAVSAGAMSPRDAMALVYQQRKGAQSALGKLSEDYRNGLITEADYRAGVAKATSHSPLVTIGGGEKKYDEKRGEAFAAQIGAIEDQAAAARSALSNLDIMEGLVSKDSFYSGFGGETAATALKALGALGGDVAGVADAEAFTARAKALALDAVGGSLGVGFSNADRDFITAQVPSLQNTREGNIQIIGILRKMNNRKLEIARMARAYEKQHGRIDGGFMDQLDTWAQENPLFPTEDRAAAFARSNNIPPGTKFRSKQDGKIYLWDGTKAIPQ